MGRTTFVTGAIAMEGQENTSSPLPPGQRAGSLPVASGAGQAGALQQGLAPLSADQADHGGALHRYAIKILNNNKQFQAIRDNLEGLRDDEIFEHKIDATERDRE